MAAVLFYNVLDMANEESQVSLLIEGGKVTQIFGEKALGVQEFTTGWSVKHWYDQSPDDSIRFTMTRKGKLYRLVIPLSPFESEELRWAKFAGTEHVYGKASVEAMAAYEKRLAIVSGILDSNYQLVSPTSFFDSQASLRGYAVVTKGHRMSGPRKDSEDYSINALGGFRAKHFGVPKLEKLLSTNTAHYLTSANISDN